jgi:hypothetical protein
MDTQRGNSKAHLIRRLKSERRSDLVAAVARGETTAYGAANEAGIRRRKRPLEIDGNVARRREFRRHPDRARRDGEMCYGPGHASAFATVEQARRYWVENRARLLPILAVDGRRPWGWWRYDDEAADLRHPGRDLERSTLFDAGLLGAEEEDQLVRDWRHEFDRSHDPNFFVCEGPGKFLHGEAARAAHYAWADIPLSLVEEWSSERAGPDDETTAAAARCVS